MARLVLYATEHCSLCEEALDMLFALPAARGAELIVIDVAADDALTERYGERLPVLVIGSEELEWPFSSERILDCLT